MKHLVAIRDSSDSALGQTILSGVETMDNSGTPKIIRIFYRFSQLPPSVNAFDEDVGMSIQNMTYSNTRSDNPNLGPWFTCKVNAGLRLINDKRGKNVPNAVRATTGNAIVAWSDSD